MPNTRILLWVALAAVLYLNYEAWMHDYAASAARDAAALSATGARGTLGDSVPQAASSAAPPLTAATPPPAAAPTAAEPFAAPAPSAPLPSAAPIAAADSSQPLHVTTDVLDVVINLKGGELDQADLLQYPLRKDAPHVPVTLLRRAPPDSLYLLQTGLLSGESAPQQNFTLAAGADELRVPLSWSDGAGLAVTKTFVFKRGSYAIDLDYDV